jgi:NTE family protein
MADRPGVTLSEEPAAGETAAPLSAAFGGGGTFGIAYGLGVCDALRAQGVEFISTEMVGTSAGAWVASCLAADVSFRHLCELPEVRVPNLLPGFLSGIANDIFGDARDGRVTGLALRLPTMKRALLRGDEHRLADVVAASSAVPALFMPTKIGPTSYVDGGVRSLVSAGLAAPARHLLVVAPIAGPMFGPGGRAMELMLRREIAQWRRRTGGTPHLVRPSNEVAALVRQPLHLFDHQRAKAAYGLAVAQTNGLLSDGSDLAQLLPQSTEAA